MSLEPAELLRRLSASLRADIGPAVADEYARTQAFMASVILERVSRQLELGPAHARAEDAEMVALVDALGPVLAGAPPAVSSALLDVGNHHTVASLGPLLEQLYAWGSAEPRVIEALGLIRPTLRKDIDRKMAVAE
ncbi:MAG: hypothetical protein O3C27_03750 [Actinomycetota bacterium]|nr:hypothetical protein [Actinomycetota bacterium]